MKITDLKCAVIGKNPVVRILTDKGISGYGEVEQYKPYLKPFMLYFRDALLGGKVRDHVRVYNGALRAPLSGCEPEHYAAEARRRKALPEGG
jgi:L-alanine-DL-glutamate epimerase-like enolase superfamily enzyme